MMKFLMVLSKCTLIPLRWRGTGGGKIDDAKQYLLFSRKPKRDEFFHQFQLRFFSLPLPPQTNHRINYMYFRYLLPLLLLLMACSDDVFLRKEHHWVSRAIEVETGLPDTLHVGTIYGSFSYFQFMGDEFMGYEHDLVHDFSQFANLPVKFHIAKSETELLDWLRHKKIDLVAKSTFPTKALKQEFEFIAYQEDSYMVLVQEIGLHTITDISELQEQTIHVIANSIYHQRLQNLKEEGDLNIQIELLPDTLTMDDAIELIKIKQIEYTVAHHRTAAQHKWNNRRLDTRVRLGFDQQNAWLINPRNIKLKEMINEWYSDEKTETKKVQLFERYKVRNPYFASKKIRIPRGAISPYDEYFKKYAKEINWDWRMLASIAFHESRFDTTQVSPRGASGLMQLMPRTAARFGVGPQDVFNPEKNIEASVQFIKSVNLMFRKIENQEERRKFVLAAYNGGPAHVLDAMALAEKHGKNPHVWFDNVEYYLAKKSDPEYYNDEVVKYGRFRATETLNYVRKTLDTYYKYIGEL